jgi:fermentation-respiration switch protein FrsA (DUF1100 family)
MENKKETILLDGKVVRREVKFPSQGSQISGWLYLPAQAPKRSPTIVMANALTAIKEITLPGYAERFAEAGFAALAIDYRFWGASGGEPRNQIIPYEMLQDIRNAITWLSMQHEVDPARIGGWGVSLGGGHMLYLAGFDRRLKAVVATATAVNSLSNWEKVMGRQGVQALLAQLGQDRVERYKTGSSATYKTAWGKMGQDALFMVDEAYDFYMNAKATFAPNFENRATVQSFENLIEYNPDFAVNLASPTAILIVHAEKDVIPIELVRTVYDRALDPKKLVVYDCKHTDLYDKEPWLTKSSKEAIDWFRKYLITYT